MNEHNIYSTENDGVSNPDDNLGTMSSVMNRKGKDDELIKKLYERMDTQERQLSNLHRENKTLRLKSSSNSNEIRNMTNMISNLQQENELYKNVLIEYSQRLDYIERYAIIKDKR